MPTKNREVKRPLRSFCAVFPDTCDGDGGKCKACKKIRTSDFENGTSDTLHEMWLGGPGVSGPHVLYRHADAGRLVARLADEVSVKGKSRRHIWAIYDAAVKTVIARETEKTLDEINTRSERRAIDRRCKENPGYPTGAGRYIRIRPGERPSNVAIKMRRHLATGAVLRSKNQVVCSVGEASSGTSDADGAKCTRYSHVANGLHVIHITDAVLRMSPNNVSSSGACQKLTIAVMPTSSSPP